MSANSSSENSQPNENNSRFEQHYISHWRKEKLHEADKSEILQALKTFKKRLNDFVLAGCDEYLAGNYERAIDYCTIALSASPVLADAYLYRGSAYFRLEEFKKATQDIWEYINIVQEDENVYQKLGLIYCNWGTSLCIAGKITEALPKLSQAIQINPRNIEAYAVRAQIFRDLGEYSKALKDYYRALKIIPNDAYLLYARGLIFMDLARYRFAIRDFEKSLSINPDFPKAREAMGEALSKIGTGAQPDFMVAAEILIGRDPNCDWVFTDNRVSRTHARIYRQGSKIMLVDLGSSNGTFIGQQKARILPDLPIEIFPGDVIYLARKQKLDLSQLFDFGYEEFGE